MNTSVQVYHGDCLEEMGKLKDGSIDAVIADLPYGVLNKGNVHARWDCVIPVEPLWEHLLRVCKPNAAMVFFAQGMFTAQMMMSQPRLWRYNLAWDKQRITGFLNSKKMPLRCHEDICVFYRSLPTYNPQMEDLNGREPNHPQGKGAHRNTNRCYGMVDRFAMCDKAVPTKKYPRSIIRCPQEHDKNHIHPTQKPVALLEWLIRTYTNEGETVLDCAMGSGTTGVACVRTGRSFVGIEKDDRWFKIGNERIENAKHRPSQTLLSL